ncbi:hypothetical protein ACFX13_044891 [Malus domestica]|uniref:Uncharacterized protein n=1 Tax=Malus domestica TaxID=3750 RepID=A0A498JA42_MALDO|nr:hypothetical protein DVH24_033565 [Malus domestica]
MGKRILDQRVGTGPESQIEKEALLAPNKKSGSSPYAIAKHKAVLPANFRKRLPLQLKNSAARGKLIDQGLVQAPGCGEEGEIRSENSRRFETKIGEEDQKNLVW